MTLYMVAVAMVGLLGMAALAIDVVSLYVARSEAQRAADAAALAGADVFVTSGFTSGLVTQSQVQTLATNEAIVVGNKNLVGGQDPNIQTGDVTFNFSSTTDPRITVTVQRTAGRGNPMPTFFARVLGFTTADVSAVATAEAYNPSGNGPPVGPTCVKPWIMPNCDPSHTSPQNPQCSTGTFAYFIDPSTGAIEHPGPVSSGGVIGLTMLLKPGSPSSAPAPSQFYPVQLPAGSTPSLCPSPSAPGCSNNNGGGGGALYRQNISCCNTNAIICGNLAVSWETGNMQGPTKQGVECLIHANGEGLLQGQDILNPATTPFTMIGGSNNPNPALVGQAITSSDSLVSVPLYNGTTPCPGNSCGPTVNITGFLQVFVQQVDVLGNVTAVITNISGCASGGSGGGTPVTNGGASPIPVRLVQPS